MKRTKVRFGNREDSRVVIEVMRRGQVICLPNHTFIVPEPAVDLLAGMCANFESLGEETWDRVVRALRDPTCAHVQ